MQKLRIFTLIVAASATSVAQAQEESAELVSSTQNQQPNGVEYFMAYGQWADWLRLRLPPTEIEEAPGVWRYREITVRHLSSLLMQHGVRPSPSVVAEAKEASDKERQLRELDVHAWQAYQLALHRGEYSMSAEELDALWVTKEEESEAKRQITEFWGRVSDRSSKELRESKDKDSEQD